MKWTKPSCHEFVDNQVRLQLFALAYNLGNFLRRLVLRAPVKHWTPTTLREKLIKIGAKVVRRSKYVRFQLAEVAVPRRLFALNTRRDSVAIHAKRGRVSRVAAILERIGRLREAAVGLMPSG